MASRILPGERVEDQSSPHDLVGLGHNLKREHLVVENLRHRRDDQHPEACHEVALPNLHDPCRLCLGHPERAPLPATGGQGFLLSPLPQICLGDHEILPGTDRLLLHPAHSGPVVDHDHHRTHRGIMAVLQFDRTLPDLRGDHGFLRGSCLIEHKALGTSGRFKVG